MYDIRDRPSGCQLYAKCIVLRKFAASVADRSMIVMRTLECRKVPYLVLTIPYCS
jgi:hypothetical protein